MVAIIPNVNGSPHEIESTVTDRHPTTVPQDVVLERDATISNKADPAVESFLDLLKRDITEQPQRLKPVTADMVNRLVDLVGSIDVDLDAPLPDEDDELTP